MTLHVGTADRVTTVVIDRPGARNAVDGPTAQALFDAFVAFDRDPQADVAVLAGASDTFCAGADLKAVALGMGEDARANPIHADMNAIAPMGCTRLALSKPVIAAVSGYAVAGGIELALWCDLRVVEETATLGVFCRRWGVPLIDGGTVRLPRLIGQSRALDLILTGRPVGAQEALDIGLANRVVPHGQALAAAQALARDLARFPQACLRSDRRSAIEQWGMEFTRAMQNEFTHGLATMASGETKAGAARFAAGAGRHGTFG
ncbi:MAG: crotonase/enoyl-CoA hydratase family protein [Burkholderiales bacterium]|nr:crotonase/enoyl-CoA hydratase family protein [Burkholderiales bacterium]